MNVYFINTSHRMGYTTEIPDMAMLNMKGEYVINEQSLTTPVLHRKFQTGNQIYKVFAMEQVRGKDIEIGVQYFETLADANFYKSRMKKKYTSKTESEYMLETLKIYPSIQDIPTKMMIEPNEMGVEIQIAKRNDFRMNTNLSMDQIMERYMQERSFFKQT